MTDPAQPLLSRPDAPRVVVDLSNVCRDRTLGAGGRRAAWSRFERLGAAWRRQLGGPPAGLAIADANLRFLLSPADRRRLEVAERAGAVRVARGGADAEILALAERSGALVLSMDLFRGHRRAHPWIQGCADRFYGWEADTRSGVRVAVRDMGRSSDHSLSRHEESDSLRGRGFDVRRRTDRSLLRHAYRCPRESCLHARYNPERLLVPPVRGERRDPRCPGCGTPLVDLGRRPPAVEIVVDLDGRETLRRMLEEGEEVELGRADVEPRDGAPAPREVSRRHLLLTFEDGRLLARDLGSRNGTAVARWSRERGAFGRPVAIPGERAVVLGPRDVAVLAGVARVRRSGRRFAIGAPHLHGMRPDADIVPVTAAARLTPAAVPPAHG
jgi:FHA domain